MLIATGQQANHRWSYPVRHGPRGSYAERRSALSSSIDALPRQKFNFLAQCASAHGVAALELMTDQILHGEQGGSGIVIPVATYSAGAVDAPPLANQHPFSEEGRGDKQLVEAVLPLAGLDADQRNGPAQGFSLDMLDGLTL